MAGGIAGAAAENIAPFGGAAGSGQPEIIHLDDGTRLTLLGTSVKTGQPTDVWIRAEYGPNTRPTYELMVSDVSNTACVNIEGRNSSLGTNIQYFELNAYPRWDKTTILRVKRYGGAISKEEFVISNPPVATVTNWIPEPLPVTKSDGDLEVTLTKLVAGAPTPSWRGGSLTPTNDPANQCVHLNFDIRQNGQPATNWQAWPVETFDATGNHVRGVIYDYPTNGVRRIWGHMKDGSYIPPPEHYGMDGYYFQPGLWPDRPWKVRLELIQRSGFSDEETVTFTNLAVRPGSQQDFDEEWTWNARNTNFNFVAEQKVNGVKLELLPPLLYSPRIMPGEKHLSVLIYADPGKEARAMNLTLLGATDENGREVATPFRNGGGWAGHFVLDFPNVGQIKTLNLRLALHKSRFFEFTVTPTKP